MQHTSALYYDQNNVQEFGCDEVEMGQNGGGSNGSYSKMRTFTSKILNVINPFKRKNSSTKFQSETDGFKSSKNDEIALSSHKTYTAAEKQLIDSVKENAGHTNTGSCCLPSESTSSHQKVLDYISSLPGDDSSYSSCEDLSETRSNNSIHSQEIIIEPVTKSPKTMPIDIIKPNTDFVNPFVTSPCVVYTTNTEFGDKMISNIYLEEMDPFHV
uniref:Uncharacterized protein n=1 Tax=Rhabditophanes sp. KR3021 TaxID=114890 RepID=A0AC35UC39_9BILA